MAYWHTVLSANLSVSHTKTAMSGKYFVSFLSIRYRTMGIMISQNSHICCGVGPLGHASAKLLADADAAQLFVWAHVSSLSIGLASILETKLSRNSTLAETITIFRANIVLKKKKWVFKGLDCLFCFIEKVN